MAKRGYLDGAEMAASFNMLRANDLIWSFVINNYLLGKDPFPFDLLYWNSDNTRMPAAMHSFYLRKCYHENVLVEPGGVSLGGVPIDLRRIDCRSTGSRPRRTISRPGRAPTPRPSSITATSGSCWPGRGTSPAWSTRRPRASTATGSTTRCRPDPEAWFAGASTTTAPGGPTGRVGTRPSPATRCRPRARRRRAAACSRTLPGHYVRTRAG